MNRPLITLACVYLAGLILGEVLVYLPITVVSLLCLAILTEAILLRRGFPIPQNKPLFFVLMAAMVYAYLGIVHHPPNEVSRYIGSSKIVLTGYIDEALVHYPDRSVVILKAQSVGMGEVTEEVTGRIRLRGSGPFLGQYQYGDILKVGVTLREPRGFLNPGLFNFGKYLKRHHIVAEATVSHPRDVTLVGERRYILFRDVYAWREKIRQAALHSLSDEPLAIFLAMMIGETGYLTNTLRDHFMASGTTHILSISGSHLGLVAIVVFTLSRLIILSLPQRWLLRMGLYLTASQLSALFTLFPVLFYALLAGGQVATVRSLIMILVYLLAIVIRRDDNLLNALALSAILVLLWDPQALGDISFQLSYGSVLIMALALERLRASETPQNLGQRLLRKGRVYLVVTVAATLGTAPLVAYHFNQMSWVGIFANLLVIPIAGVVIVPLGLFCAIGALFFEDAALPLAGLLQGLYGLFYEAVRLFSEVPWAELRLPSPSLILMGILYFLLFAVMTNRPRITARRVILAAVLLLPILGMANLAGPGSSNSLRITFLDVGQGDSAVVRFPDGQVMVVDGGRAFGDYDLGRLVVAPYLWDQGIHHIHYLVASHPQLDHMGGLTYLMERFSIGEVWTNGVEREAEFYQEFRSLLHQKRLVERKITREDPPLWLGSCLVHVLNPPASLETPIKPGRSSAENNRSIVLKLSCPPYSFILAGDIEKEAERELLDLGELTEATVIKVPHHGSRSSIEPAFLSTVHPKVAVISAGIHNPYGHPAPEVLSAYRQLGSQIFRTDQQGAILIEVRQDALRLRETSDLILRPVNWDSKVLFSEWENVRRLIHPPSALVLDKG